jgi:F-type H+-transporting ATPase subunit b
MLITMSTVIAAGGVLGAEEVNNPVIPTGPEMVWGLLAFVTLFILMKAVCLPPIRQAMRLRDDVIRSDEEAAERAKVEGEQVRRDYDATLAEARAEAARLVDAARAEADGKRAEILRAAEEQAATLRQNALAEIETQRAAALEQLKPKVTEIAVSAAGKVVHRTLDVAANEATVSQHVGSATAKG